MKIAQTQHKYLAAITNNLLRWEWRRAGKLCMLATLGVISVTTAVRAAEKTIDQNVVKRETVIKSAGKMPRIHSLLVSKSGDMVIEHVFAGPPLDTPVNIKSVSKTVIATLVGVAIERNIIKGVDQPVVALLQDQVPGNATSGVDKITVGNLLSLQAGLRRTSGTYYGAWVNSDNWVAHVLTRPFVAEPGGDMLYSTGSTHLLSAALTEASGRSTLQLARDWLGKPLGIEIPPWVQDPQGYYLGGNQMALSPRALLKFGEVVRNGGSYNNQQVIPQAWIQTSWQPRGRSPYSGHLYGYGWFINELAGEMVYSARGYGGQMLYVIPGLQATVVITADTAQPSPGGGIYQRMNRWLEQNLLPALSNG